MEIYYQFLNINNGKLEYNYLDNVGTENWWSVYQLKRDKQTFYWERGWELQYYNKTEYPTKRFPVIITSRHLNQWLSMINFHEWHLYSDIYRIYVNDYYMGAVYLYVNRWLFIRGSHKKLDEFFKFPRVRLPSYDRKPIYGLSTMSDLQATV